MIWLSPLAWSAALLVAVPIAIHLLSRTRATLVTFPTLRFIQSTRLASIRRKVLEDGLLLAIRCGIVIAAVAAFAAPVLMTRGRIRDWDARVNRHVVDRTPGMQRGDLARAIAALDASPPGRRELVIRSTFPLGSLTDEDIASIPPAFGVSFERVGTLPSQRTVDGIPVIDGAFSRARQITLDGVSTRVVDAPPDPATSAVELVAPASGRRALAAVLSQRVLRAAPDHRARVVTVDAPQFAEVRRGAGPITAGWIADAVAAIARDRDLTAASATSEGAVAPNGLIVVARNRTGEPLVGAAQADGRLLIVSGARSEEFLTALLLRAVANALAPKLDVRSADIVTISDQQLAAWSRAPGPAAPPRRDTIDVDDRRVLWAVVLILIGLETWMRRRVA